MLAYRLGVAERIPKAGENSLGVMPPGSRPGQCAGWAAASVGAPSGQSSVLVTGFGVVAVLRLACTGKRSHSSDPIERGLWSQAW